MMPGRRTKGNALTVSRRVTCYRQRPPCHGPVPMCPEQGSSDTKKVRRHEACGRDACGMAEAYRSRTYRRRLSLPPVLKTGRHTGDDTPPHDRHICDTKPGGKQACPAARSRRAGRHRDFSVSPALPIARREKRLILFLIPDRCRLTPCRRSEYLESLAQTGAPSHNALPLCSGGRIESV